MGFKMDFAGFDELAIDLERLAGEGLTSAEKESLKAGAEIVKRNQQANWNRSGASGEHIAENISIGRPFDTEEGSGISIGPKMSLRWRGKFVEYGTSYQPPQAPVEKSLSQSEDRVSSAMMSALERVIRL